MSDDDYDKAYDAGRSGEGFPGGDSTAYAGYMAGEKARASAAPHAYDGGGHGGGGVGAINIRGKVVLMGLGFGLFGMGAGLVMMQGSWWGGIIGFLIGFTIGAAFRFVIAALARALRILGRVLPFILPGAVGFLVGAAVGTVAADRMNTPREPAMITLGAAGAVIFLVLWSLGRLIARRRAAKRRRFSGR